MAQHKSWHVAHATLLFLLILRTAAGAQVASGAIAGVVKDSSGSVMPGVAVEAASPALIERVRTVITDAQGQYKIVDLRPGVYTVTFSLSGFNAVKRDGIELTTGFTATVNAELTVGSLAETITVAGASPVVDTQNVVQQKVLQNETLNSLPLGKSFAVYTTLVPGAVATAANQDVGGAKGENTQGFIIHGSRSGDFQQLRDGMFFGTMVAAGNFMSSTNPATVQESVVQTSGFTAEAETGGGQINIVPKEGTNRFNGSFKGDFGTKGLQSSNLTPALQARGISTASSIRSLYDTGGGFGGPIVVNKLWFFASLRYWVSSSYQPGNYFNATQGTLFYTPDLSRPAFDNNFYQESGGRFTWQVAPKDKITFFAGAERNCNCYFGIASGTLAPEATGDDYYWPNWRTQVSWTHPVNNKLLLDAGETTVIGLVNRRFTGGGPNDISVLNSATGYRYGAAGSSFGLTTSWGTQNFGQGNQHFTASYITGSHALKGGFFIREATGTKDSVINQDVSYTFSDATTPQSVTYWAGPYHYDVRQIAYALFAQDQWTLKRMTLNLGLRYDALKGSVPAQNLPAGPYVPARNFAPINDAPNWKDLEPRLGLAYDLFGNGKTALKASLGRFVTFEAAGGTTLANNPVNTMVTSTTRNWGDANHDYVPQESELGPTSNTAFGTVVQNTFYADDVLHGFEVRPYSWQGQVGVQQELRPGVALTVGYFRTSYGNFTVTDNQAITPADYTAYTITAPVNASLPGGGGNVITGLYDISPQKFGTGTSLIEQASKYGKQTEVFTGIDVTISARFNRSGVVTGGLSTGHTVTDSCFVVDSPQQLYQCHNETPWSGTTQIKVAVVYPLPWDLQVSANFQNLPPIPTTASLTATNAQILPSLNRNLGSCGVKPTCNGTAIVALIPPNSYFLEPRNNQLDLRFTRTFRTGRTRIQPEFDIFNAFNGNAILTENVTYGPSWQNATAILAPRLIKFGVQVYF